MSKRSELKESVNKAMEEYAETKDELVLVARIARIMASNNWPSNWVPTPAMIVEQMMTDERVKRDGPQ